MARVLRSSVASILRHWRVFMRKYAAARKLQATARGRAARRNAAAAFSAAKCLQRHWRHRIERRKRLLVRLWLRWGWKALQTAVLRLRHQREVALTAVRRWQQSALRVAVNTWTALRREREEAMGRAMAQVKRSQLSRAWQKWRSGQTLRSTMMGWREQAHLSQSLGKKTLDAALQIQSFLRRRKAQREHDAARILQTITRSTLERRRCATSDGSASSVPPQERSEEDAIETSALLAETSAASEHQLRAVARHRKATKVASERAAHIQPGDPTDPNERPTVESQSGPAVDPNQVKAIRSLKSKYAELKKTLVALEKGDKLRMLRSADDRLANVTMWVEIELKQLRWQREMGRSRIEHGQPFDLIRRVTWGTTLTPFMRRHVRNAKLAWGCECVDGSWLSFEASSAEQLRRWVLGLQALVTKPGQPLIQSTEMDWLQPGESQITTTPARISARMNSPDDRANDVIVERFDINQALREAFDNALRANGDTFADVHTLADEIELLLAQSQRHEGVGREDMRALQRVHQALLQHDLGGSNRESVSFTEVVQALTSEEAQQSACLYSRAGPTTLKGAHAGWNQDLASLARAGLRLGETIEVRMPVFEGKGSSESKWLWRTAVVTRKAAGRYFVEEDEQLRARLATLSSEGKEHESNDWASLDRLIGFDTLAPTHPRWLSTPLEGGGLPVFELYFPARRPTRGRSATDRVGASQFEGFVRWGGLPEQAGFPAVYREGAFIIPRAGGEQNRVWLRATPGYQLLHPTEVIATLQEGDDEWHASVRVEGGLLFLQGEACPASLLNGQRPTKKGARDELAFDLERCTLTDSPGGKLAVLGPDVQRRYESDDAALLLKPCGSSLAQPGGGGTRDPADVSADLRKDICARQRKTFEWRRLRQPNLVPTISADLANG